jgi:hypothetical protein
MAEDIDTRNPTPQPNAAPPAPPARGLRRVLHSTVWTGLGGAMIVGVLGGVLGALHVGDIVAAALGALAGAAVGALYGLVLGAALGAFGGLAEPVFAWVFDGPWKGALRCGGIFIALAGLMGLGVVIASGEQGLGHALAVVLPGIAIGGVAGAGLGALLGWLAGPIFRG